MAGMRCCLGLVLFLWHSVVWADLLQVGPGKAFTVPSEAAASARDGDIVEIDAAGSYEGDVAVWTQSNLTLRGVNGRPHIRGTGRHAEGKALWVIKGDNTTVENIEFSGAVVPDRNGAGIRHEGRGLVIRHSYFHHNENGILSSSDPASQILIEHSEFSHNGRGDGLTHNIYIGRIKRFTLRYSYIHHANVGHNIKSRAGETWLVNNRIMDEKAGNSSYAVDLPNGGRSFVIGNVIQQGRGTENWTIVSYGAEGLRNPDNRLWMLNNTVVNDRHSGVFVRTAGGSEAWLFNNLFVGAGKLLQGHAVRGGNVGPLRRAGLMDRARYDYRLSPASPAVDAGLSAQELERRGIDAGLLPQFEYVHVAGKRQRDYVGPVDAGAHELRAAGL